MAVILEQTQNLWLTHHVALLKDQYIVHLFTSCSTKKKGFSKKKKNLYKDSLFDGLLYLSFFPRQLEYKGLLRSFYIVVRLIRHFARPDSLTARVYLPYAGKWEITRQHITIALLNSGHLGWYGSVLTLTWCSHWRTSRLNGTDSTPGSVKGSLFILPGFSNRKKGSRLRYFWRC